MVLYRLIGKIFNNRLECKKNLNLSCSQYKRLIMQKILIPINREDIELKPEKV